MKLYYVEYIQSYNYQYNIRTELLSFDVELTINNIPYFIRYDFLDCLDVMEIVHFKEKNNLMGNIHKNEGPAIISYHITPKTINYVEYYIDNKAHRVYGPSDIFYNSNGAIERIRWYYNDKNYTDEVNNWLDENKFNSWKDMNKDDFNQMWFEIL